MVTSRTFKDFDCDGFMRDFNNSAVDQTGNYEAVGNIQRRTCASARQVCPGEANEGDRAEEKIEKISEKVQGCGNDTDASSKIRRRIIRKTC